MMRAQIIKIISNQFTVRTDDGQKLLAVLRKKAKRNQIPYVGDFVEVDKTNEDWTIESILPRKNALNRPPVANIDQAIIVMSVKEPDFSYALVDRLIFLISYEEIQPVLLLTKLDLSSKEEYEPILNEYKNAGYPVYTNQDDKEVLEGLFRDKTTVLCGQSGVGKSSFLNDLDETFQLPTQPISLALGRGKHTTRHCELYEVFGGLIVDTPGFSSLDFSRIDSLELAKRIPDFQVEEGCRFDDCKHNQEPGCKVKEGVEEGRVSSIRYQNYLEILPMCDQVKEWEK